MFQLKGQSLEIACRNLLPLSSHNSVSTVSILHSPNRASHLLIIVFSSKFIYSNRSRSESSLALSHSLLSPSLLEISVSDWYITEPIVRRAKKSMERRGWWHVVVSLLMCAAVRVRSDASDHKYKVGDPVPLYANKVGPFHNPR